MRDFLPKDIRGIRRHLLEWYGREARDLPWRRTRDPYAIWLSEILLQQTRVDQGLPYYERFIAAFPTVAALAAADEERVLKAWEGLGYYARARNMQKAARVILNERNGLLPATLEEWQSLPGVGRYTAGAVASIAYGVRAPVLDGNVKRVLSRLLDVEESIDDPAMTEALWERAATLVPRDAPGDFNQGMMELGARICVPRGPRCGECPVRKHCLAFQLGTQELRPVRKARKAVPFHETVGLIIRRNGRYLLAKRPAKGLLSGLWEFPGGKVEPGESHADALHRIAREHLGVEVKVGGVVAVVDHAYSHLKVRLSLYACALAKGTPKANAHDDLRWVPRGQFDLYAFPNVNRKILHLL
ncbi:MAG: A/G-specific adenine glycosylase [FCB group bacterium]|jgi:A/G-specific adenine glycosylase|nr:A/G-specific adenine glycosylase [FCB group bacterium]